MEYLVGLIFTFTLTVSVMYFGLDKPIIEALIWAALISPVLSLLSKVQTDSSFDYHSDAEVDPITQNKSMLIGLIVFGLFFVGVGWYVAA